MQSKCVTTNEANVCTCVTNVLVVGHGHGGGGFDAKINKKTSKSIEKKTKLCVNVSKAP